MADGSKISIYAALAGNIAVAAVKFGAYALSGSSAMLTEAIHSLVDTANQLLLLFGLRRGSTPPDDDHPFGHGMEVYFWTFVVSLLIFTLGGAVAVYQGVLRVLHPTPIEHAGVTMAVIALSAMFEGASFITGVRQERLRRPALSRRRYPKLWVMQTIHFSKDPGVFEVLAEDGAAILGLVFAALGVAGSAWFGWAQADGLASIAIGVLLAAVAYALGSETYSLLTGEAALAPVVDGVRAILQADDRVDQVCEVLSMHLGPQEILIAATLDFEDTLSGPQLEEAADQLTDRLKAADPRITRLFLRPGRAKR
jgi:cation diffusion facilitator family transporter